MLGNFMHTVHCMISKVPSIQCMNFSFQYLYDKTTNTLKFPSHPRAKGPSGQEGLLEHSPVLARIKKIGVYCTVLIL